MCTNRKDAGNLFHFLWNISTDGGSGVQYKVREAGISDPLSVGLNVMNNYDLYLQLHKLLHRYKLKVYFSLILFSRGQMNLF